jgi:hypothetical protein
MLKVVETGYGIVGTVCSIRSFIFYIIGAEVRTTLEVCAIFRLHGRVQRKYVDYILNIEPGSSVSIMCD